MTITQAATSYRYDGENPKKCDKNAGKLYPYGNYSSGYFVDPPTVPIVEPLVDQAILEYGISNAICNIDCLGKINDPHCGSFLPRHEGDLRGTSCSTEEHECRSDFQIEMEQLKSYRFKCYECVNPCCPSNMLALQMIRETRLNKSGTTTTTMSYGSTGTSTTTTTTVKF